MATYCFISYVEESKYPINSSSDCEVFANLNEDELIEKWAEFIFSLHTSNQWPSTPHIYILENCIIIYDSDYTTTIKSADSEKNIRTTRLMDTAINLANKRIKEHNTKKVQAQEKLREANKLNRLKQYEELKAEFEGK